MRRYPIMHTSNFLAELEGLLNKYSMECCSGTPNHVAANYLHACLLAFNEATNSRKQWTTASPTFTKDQPA